MAQTSYDVPMVEQGAENPICWVASMAMVESFWTQSSVGVGKYTGGFDPSLSCIENMATDVVDFQNRMASFGFFPVYPDEELTMSSLYEASERLGPLIYFHNVSGFPYLTGPGTGGGAHAVVITGTDTGQDCFWFNNPWGDKDTRADASAGLAPAADPNSRSYSLYFGNFVD